MWARSSHTRGFQSQRELRVKSPKKVMCNGPRRERFHDVIRRLLISVEPRLLGTSLAVALDGPAVEIMVHNGGEPPRGRADVAIVTGADNGEIEASTVIALPNHEGGSGVALVRSGGEVEAVPVITYSDLRRVVDALIAP